MRKILIPLLLAIIIAELFFGRNRWNIFFPDTQLVVVHFYTQNCQECQILKHKLQKIQWMLNSQPIVFADLDRSHKAIFDKNKAFFQEIHLWEEVKKVDVLRKAVVFKLPTKQIIATFDYQADEKNIENILRKSCLPF